MDTTIVASILPLSQDSSSTLGDGSDSEQDNSCVPPFRASSLFLHCHINGPALPHSVAVKALIDYGAQVVLIRDSLAHQTGLRFHLLPAPCSLGTAFDDDDDDDASPEQLIATHWIELALSSWNSVYTSRTIRAFVCRGNHHAAATLRTGRTKRIREN